MLRCGPWVLKRAFKTLVSHITHSCSVNYSESADLWLEAYIRSWGRVLVVPSARLDAYSGFALGLPSNLLLLWFGNPLALFLIVFSSRKGFGNQTFPSMYSMGN